MGEPPAAAAADVEQGPSFSAPSCRPQPPGTAVCFSRPCQFNPLALQSLPLVLERKLEPAVSVPVYASNSDALRGTNAVTKDRPLCKGAPGRRQASRFA